jgi:cell division protein FtsI/penicillin-binding protein 2
MLTSITKPSDNSIQKDKDTIEMQIFNKTNLNQYPAIKFDKDIEGNISSGQFIPPNNNVNVRLTIDKNIENKVKEVFNSERYRKYNQIGAVLMESSTGKILTMSQKNDSLPNVNLGSSTLNGFEPGSIFKIIVEEAGLDRKSLSLVEKYSCKQSIYSGTYDKCKEKDHGILNAEDALVVSCNNIFAQIGDKVGVNNFLDNAQSQGLFSKVLNFDSEVKGTFVRPELGEGAGQLAIGQSMSITPIQAVNVVNAIVNNGTYVKPYIIDSYVDNDNKELEILKTEQHPSINKSTANLMKNELEKVVRYGTGTSARIENIETGGKTGTSTRFDGKEYTSDGWFVGFFKQKNKYYSMVVYVQNIDKEDEEAANTAAPVFKNLVQSLSPYLQKNN